MGENIPEASATGSENGHVEKILKICNELSLGMQFEESDFEISKFKSGYVSEIYRITFTKPHPPLSNSLVIKFYNTDASKDETGYEIINSQLNNLFIAQANLGPKILLILKDAIVMEFVPSEQLNQEHDQDPRIREDVARKLARLHSLSVPVSRNHHAEGIHQMFNVWLSQELIDSVYVGTLKPHLEELGLPNLLGTNFRSEADFVHNAIMASEPNSTIVFSHCDFNHLNLLVSKNESQEPEVRFIDFDFSTYFFRGADLGRYFVDCKQPEQFHPNDLIPDSEILEFLNWYRDQSAAIYGPSFLDNPKNSLEALLKEAKLFALYAFMVDIIFCIFMAEMLEKGDEKEKMVEFLKHGDKRYAGYLKAKARFLEDGSVP